MKQLLKTVYTGILAFASQGWQPYSRLILTSDNSGWSLDWDMRELGHIASSLGIRIVGHRWQYASTPQSLFFANQFFLTKRDWLDMPHRIGFSYFHGFPNTGDESFDRVYEALRKHHERISRIQASNSQMRDTILESGISASKVFLIPIGINLSFFPLRNADDKLTARQQLGIPQSAFVIGSFQKDGIGWGEGNEPKLIKGPDVFLSVIRRIKDHIPELYVLLSGPARGYIKKGLDELKVPYSHIYLNSYPKIGKLYRALDLYLVTSRQEGGPKAILESMASGVPIVSTRTGQAVDLIKHGQNGWLTDIQDVESLASWTIKIYTAGHRELVSIVAEGRATAETNSYVAQIPLWKQFMKGFVEWEQ
jgi:glycosyltransferase involved in cell wall biosynthesis